MSDSTTFDIAGFELTDALELVGKIHPKVTHYFIEPSGATPPSSDSAVLDDRPVPRMVLFWTRPKSGRYAGAQKLPGPISPLSLHLMIQAWLDSDDPDPYPPYPDLDGSATKGCRVYCEAWGHVGGDWAAIAAIEPHWELHGK